MLPRPRLSALVRLGATTAAGLAVLAGGITPAHADVHYQKRWFVTGHAADGMAYGSWHACGTALKSSKVQHLTCTQSHSTTVSVTMSITGTQEVSTSSLSAAVGYTVAHTSMESIADSVDIPANSSSTTIYYRTSSNRTKVQQKACDVVVNTGRCSDAYYGTTYAYTHKFYDMQFKTS